MALVAPKWQRLLDTMARILEHGPKMAPTRLPDHVVRRIAAEAQVNPKTVRRLLKGMKIRPMGSERIAKAFAASGIRWDEVVPAPIESDEP